MLGLLHVVSVVTGVRRAVPLLQFNKLLLYLQQVGLLLASFTRVFTLLLFYLHQQQLLLFTQGSLHFQSVQYML